MLYLNIKHCAKYSPTVLLLTLCVLTIYIQVNGVALPLKRSQILSQWGLSDVLTTMSDEERQKYD